VLGGGFSALGASSLSVIESAPVPDGSGWQVIADNATATALEIRASAICANVAP